MTITDAERHRLHTKLDQVLGEEDAAVLISHLPPSGWSDVTRTRDLDQLEQRMNLRFQAVDERFDALEQRMDLRFQATEARVDTRIAELGERLQRELRRATVLHLTITSVIATLVVTLTQLAAP